MLNRLFLVGVEHRVASLLCLLALTVLAALGVPKTPVSSG
jgi:hypothetical protein